MHLKKELNVFENNIGVRYNPPADGSTGTCCNIQRMRKEFFTPRGFQDGGRQARGWRQKIPQKG